MHSFFTFFLYTLSQTKETVKNGTPSQRQFFLTLVYVVDRTLPHPVTCLVQCVWPHHQISAMTCINTGCTPITHRVDCNVRRCNFNKNEGGQRQIKPLSSIFIGFNVFSNILQKRKFGTCCEFDILYVKGF